MSDSSSPPSKLWSSLDSGLRLLEVAAAVFGGVMMLTSMVLTTADALMRYAFNSPIPFNFFLTENYLMVALICMPLAWAFRNGGYIRIMFLYATLPPYLGNLLLRAGLFAGFLLIADLAWLSGWQWYKSYSTNEIVMEVVDWPMAWSWIWVPVGLALLAARLLLTVLGPTEDLNIKHDPEEEAL